MKKEGVTTNPSAGVTMLQYALKYRSMFQLIWNQ